MKPDCVTEAQLKSLFRPGSIPPSNLTAAIILSIILWPYIDSWLLLPWVGAAIVLDLGVNFTKSSFKKKVFNEIDIRHWMYLGLAFEFMFGLLWSYACLFFSIDKLNMQYEILNFTIVVSVVVSGFARHVVYLPAFYIFSFPVMIAFMVRCLVIGDYLNIWMFVLSMLGFITFVTFARQINKEFLDNIRLRFKNMDLAEKLSKKKAMAEKANLAKSKYLAAASHDVRQPLSALLLHYEVVKGRNKAADLDTHINNVGLSINSLNHLFTSFIDISKLDAGIISPKKQHYSLTKITSQINSDYALEAENKGLMWVYDIADFTIYSDPVLVESLIRNLVSNAMRYTNAGCVSIVARVNESNNCVELTINDTGVGIPNSKQEKIFEEFHQLNHPDASNGDGFGLGLSIVKRIVLSLDLKLALSSETDVGTSFMLHLPLGDAAMIKKEEELVDTITSGLTGLRVLVVDDDVTILSGLHDLLEGWGCLVTPAMSLAEASKLVVNAGQFDCIIVDYDLKNHETGVDLVKLVERHYGQSLPTLLITGNMTDLPIHVANQHKCFLLHKPVKPAKIRCFLQQVPTQRKEVTANSSGLTESETG